MTERSTIIDTVERLRDIALRRHHQAINSKPKRLATANHEAGAFGAYEKVLELLKSSPGERAADVKE